MFRDLPWTSGYLSHVILMAAPGAQEVKPTFPGAFNNSFLITLNILLAQTGNMANPKVKL